MQVGVIPEETAVLIRWKKRSDNHVLVRMKAEAEAYAKPWHKQLKHLVSGTMEWSFA